MPIVPSQSEAPPSYNVMYGWMRVGLMKGARTMRITRRHPLSSTILANKRNSIPLDKCALFLFPVLFNGWAFSRSDGLFE